MGGWPGGYLIFRDQFSRNGLVHEIQLIDGTSDEKTLGMATSGREEDRETGKEERIQQTMVELRRRKNEPGRYLKMLRTKPKVSMTAVSRADALEEIEREKLRVENFKSLPQYCPVMEET